MMYIRVVEPPAEIVSLERVKSHLNLEADDAEFDDLVAGYVAAAVAWLDGPEGWLGRSLGPQTLELVGEFFPCARLPYGPVLEVESVNYLDVLGDEQTVPNSDYRLLSDGRLHAADWPSIGQGPDAVRIRYKAGYADGVPTPIVQAVLLLVGQWFKTRENVVTGTIATAVPFSVEALLAPYRVWR